MSRSNLTTMILAGGRGLRLLPLTRHRCKPAVGFAASLRMIDFTLFNCAAAGFDRVHVLTQYRAGPLHEHLAARWGSVPGLPRGFASAMPAATVDGEGKGHYTGTADAVRKGLEALPRRRDGVVLILSGDHVYRADYRRLIEAHEASQAEVTVLTGEVPSDEAPAYGVLTAEASGRVLDFVEKPIDGRPHARDGRCLINLGIYCFEASFLTESLRRDAEDPRSSHDFGADVLPASLAAGATVRAFPLSSTTPDRCPYWRDLGTIESYFEASMDLVRSPPSFSLVDPRWPPRSAFHAWLPRLERSASGQCLYAPTAHTEGARLERCIVSDGAIVEPGAELEDSVLLPGCHVGAGARLSRAIVDEGVRVPATADTAQSGVAALAPGTGISLFAADENDACGAPAVATILPPQEASPSAPVGRWGPGTAAQ